MWWLVDVDIISFCVICRLLKYVECVVGWCCSFSVCVCIVVVASSAQRAADSHIYCVGCNMCMVQMFQLNASQSASLSMRKSTFPSSMNKMV